jgi:hypothetical protein
MGELFPTPITPQVFFVLALKFILFDMKKTLKRAGRNRVFLQVSHFFAYIHVIYCTGTSLIEVENAALRHAGFLQGYVCADACFKI